MVCDVAVDVVGDNDTPGPHGCISSQGKILQNGDSWQEDPCTSCVCVDGLKKCQAYMCEVSCVNPTYVPDECCPFCNCEYLAHLFYCISSTSVVLVLQECTECTALFKPNQELLVVDAYAELILCCAATSVVVVPPHCPALNNCSLRCLQGFVRDAAGCFLCQCKAEECVLHCADGYEQDNHGNKLCQCATPPTCPPLVGCHKNCSHGYRLSKDGCPICRCSQCRQLTDCIKSCVHGLRTNDRGCTICKCRGKAANT
ncbi:hypothetical protein PR048_031338 [Dryococelus australis]|uniref:Kielin/chordin-like protein n=1 Tax=Dryococelus australis TaxID=614101 RepID=A0ABQ9G7Q4_9NEOP|nr:hypothetical protein PR048_031338 [Dryococelus australis]